MGVDEREIGTSCADCGAAVEPGLERGYASADWALCWACAVKRGGRFDDEGDRWAVDPSVEDLDVSEHRVR